MSFDSQVRYSANSWPLRSICLTILVPRYRSRLLNSARKTITTLSTSLLWKLATRLSRFFSRLPFCWWSFCRIFDKTKLAARRVFGKVQNLKFWLVNSNNRFAVSFQMQIFQWKKYVTARQGAGSKKRLTSASTMWLTNLLMSKLSLFGTSTSA